MTMLRGRYPEMETAGDDLGMEQLMHDLHRMGEASRTAALPPHHERRIAHALRQEAAKPVRRGRNGYGSRPLFRRNRPVAIVVAAICTLLLAGAAYSAITVLDQAFNMNPGTQRIVAGNLGRVLGLSRTVDGFTFTIGRVYADANQIVIGYTIGGPPNRTFNSLLPFAPPDPHIPQLIDAAGREFPSGAVSWGTGVQDGRVGGVLTYDAGGISGAPKELTLRFTVGGISAIERTGADPSALRDVAVHQAFGFTFTVPFDGGRVAELRNAATVGGTTVTLERIAVSKTETRVFIRGAGPAADVRLMVDGSDYALDQDGAIPSRRTPGGLWSYGTATSLVDTHGPWTLVVEPGVGPPGSPTLTGGPWTFHFTVP